jgi:hypothetical protein
MPGNPDWQGTYVLRGKYLLRYLRRDGSLMFPKTAVGNFPDSGRMEGSEEDF